MCACESLRLHVRVQVNLYILQRKEIWESSTWLLFALLPLLLYFICSTILFNMAHFCFGNQDSIRLFPCSLPPCSLSPRCLPSLPTHPVAMLRSLTLRPSKVVTISYNQYGTSGVSGAARPPAAITVALKDLGWFSDDDQVPARQGLPIL